MSWTIVTAFGLVDTPSIGSQSVVSVACQAVASLITGLAQEMSLLTNIVPVKIVTLIAGGANVFVIIKSVAGLRNLNTLSTIKVVPIGTL